MNKSFLLLIFLSLFLLYEVSATSTIYDYMKGLDSQYVLVVGDRGKSSDSIAATKLALALQNDQHISLSLMLESEVSPNINKILIGHPCTNGLIQLSCEEWPYAHGQALIKIIGNDLILAGTTDEDVIFAAEVLGNYVGYPLFRNSSAVLVLSTPLNTTTERVIRAKSAFEFVCGDQVCEPGEKYECNTDCEGTSCFDLCKDKGFINAVCKDTPSNPNVPMCEEGWVTQGQGYCSTGKTCCCEKEQQQTQQTEQQSEQQEGQAKKRSFFQRIIDWFVELFRTVF